MIKIPNDECCKGCLWYNIKVRISGPESPVGDVVLVPKPPWYCCNPVIDPENCLDPNRDNIKGRYYQPIPPAPAEKPTALPVKNYVPAFKDTIMGEYHD